MYATNTTDVDYKLFVSVVWVPAYNSNYLTYTWLGCELTCPLSIFML